MKGLKHLNNYVTFMIRREPCPLYTLGTEPQEFPMQQRQGFKKITSFTANYFIIAIYSL